jgi:putative membrane protein
MSPELKAVFLNWDIPPWTTLALLLTAVVYVRGWLLIGKTRPEQFPEWRLGSFLAGLFSLFLAVASPFDTLDGQLLSAHMVQHFLFMSVAPPLLLLGAPQVPLLRGLPRIFVRRVLGPFFRMHWLKQVGRFLTSLKLAQPGARLLLLHQHHVLVAHPAAMADPPEGAALDAASLHSCGGHCEYRPFGIPLLCRSADLSQLRDADQSAGHERAE